MAWPRSFDDPEWLRHWAENHRRASVYLYGVRSTYWARLRAARMDARADRLEGKEPRDAVAVATDYIHRIYGE